MSRSFHRTSIAAILGLFGWLTHLWGEVAPKEPRSQQSAPIPSLAERAFVAPLADAYSRIDPTKDGWTTEALSDAAIEQLAEFKAWLVHPEDAALGEAWANAVTTPWLPATMDTAFTSDGISIRRYQAPTDAPAALSLQQAAKPFLNAFAPHTLSLKFKVYRVDPAPKGDAFTTRVRVEASGLVPGNKAPAQKQYVAEWDMRWTNANTKATLTSIHQFTTAQTLM